MMTGKKGGESVRIKEVEDLVGITRKNIRFYEKEGLLSPGRELENSYRDYSAEDVARLRIIKLLRKLDMPISSISDVLEGRISLREASHLHALLLEEQQAGIANAQRVCHMISEAGCGLEDLDTEHYLDEIACAEAGSTVLVNIHSSDTVKKYRESVLASGVIVAILLALATLVLILSHRGVLPVALVYVFAGLIFLLMVGVIVALISRIREIRGGEENDLSQY